MLTIDGHPKNRHISVVAAAGLALLLGVTWLVYWPGLSGTFLFDDWSNLSLLGAYGRIDNRESLILYLLSGFSSPTGRPVSALSFLIDANNWPADPWAFKRTNVLIHLSIGAVLYGLIRQLTLALGRTGSQANRVAILATAIWLLHPFWVSTTLYAVQRMAQLSALFVLLGLWLYVRTRLSHSPALNGGTVAGTAAAVCLLGLLAVLSKENGALLPLLIATTEATVLKEHDRANGATPTLGFRIWRLALLAIPSLVLASVVAQRELPALLHGIAGTRDFTPWERLLTEGRILWDYVGNLVLPRPYTGGLFNDDIVISTGLFHPWTTVLAWAGWVAILIWAWLMRQRQPALALAILFFLAGHTLESTFLRLELYFEHRSYLPAALLGFPLALWWVELRWRDLVGKVALTIAVLVVLAFSTVLRTELWGSPFQQSLQWAKFNPESPRALHHLASKWLETANFAEAERLNTRAIQLEPSGVPWLAQAIVLTCRQGRDATDDISRLESVVGSEPAVGAILRFQLSTLLDYLLENQCGAASRPEAVLALIQRLAAADLRRPKPGLQSLLEQRAGVVSLQMNDPEQAYQYFSNSASKSSDPGQQLRNAAILASHGAFVEALELLDQPPPQPQMPRRWSVDAFRLWYQADIGYFERERTHLATIIKDDLARAQRDPPLHDPPL